MEPDECRSYQNYWAKRIAAEATQKRQQEEARAEDEERRKAEQAIQDQRKQTAAADREKQQQEQAAQEKSRQKQSDEDDRRQAIADRQAAAKAASVKTKCGDDYKSPKIGMRLERVQECVVAVKLRSQLNRADGVVSTYEGGNAYFHIMDGRIVSWGKY